MVELESIRTFSGIRTTRVTASPDSPTSAQLLNSHLVAPTTGTSLSRLTSILPSLPFCQPPPQLFPTVLTILRPSYGRLTLTPSLWCWRRSKPIILTGDRFYGLNPYLDHNRYHSMWGCELYSGRSYAQLLAVHTTPVYQFTVFLLVCQQLIFLLRHKVKTFLF